MISLFQKIRVFNNRNLPFFPMFPVFPEKIRKSIIFFPNIQNFRKFCILSVASPCVISRPLLLPPCLHSESRRNHVLHTRARRSALSEGGARPMETYVLVSSHGCWQPLTVRKTMTAGFGWLGRYCSASFPHHSWVMAWFCSPELIP